ncbi:MAG: permease-like cell division protein FtsX, partial [Candidatus Aminicenantes bacterium]|nr:permease-like cell division protein FtsX [Candidatus Aminicenantes bacterium]
MNLLKTAIINSIINIMRNKVINMLSLGIIAFTLLIFGIFNYLSLNIENFTQNFSKNIVAIFYFNEGVEKKLIDDLTERLEKNVLVDSVTYFSENQSEIQFTREFPELKYILNEFKSSPFPSSIELKFKEKNKNTKITSLIEEIGKLSIVESKQVNLDWAEKITTLSRFITIAGIFLSSILIFISIFII